MGTTIGPSIKYHCLNDCRQEGCPGHEARVDYMGTSDIVRISVGEDSNPEFDYFDPRAWKALIRSWEQRE